MSAWRDLVEQYAVDRGCPRILGDDMQVLDKRLHEATTPSLVTFLPVHASREAADRLRGSSTASGGDDVLLISVDELATLIEVVDKSAAMGWMREGKSRAGWLANELRMHSGCLNLDESIRVETGDEAASPGDDGEHDQPEPDGLHEQEGVE